MECCCSKFTFANFWRNIGELYVAQNHTLRVRKRRPYDDGDAVEDAYRICSNLCPTTTNAIYAMYALVHEFVFVRMLCNVFN